MSEEKLFLEPELELAAILYFRNGKPCLNLVKHVESIEKIRLLSSIILSNEYIPCKIFVKDKLKFSLKLKELEKKEKEEELV